MDPPGEDESKFIMIGGRDLSHKKAPIAKLPQLSILSMPVADMMVDLEVDKVADEVTDMLTWRLTWWPMM